MKQITKFFDQNGVSFYKNTTDKFKTSTISVYIHCPLQKETVTKNALLPFVLKRGSRDLPDGDAVYSYLYQMYGANFSTGIAKKGEDQIIALHLDFVNDRYLPAGESIQNNALYFMNQIAFTPYTQSGAFCSEYVESEKVNVENYIRGLMNDKREYASQRCVEEMYPGDPYGLYGYGTLEQLPEIDGATLYEQYQSVIRDCRIDLFVSGTVDEKKVVETFGYLAENRAQGEFAYPLTTPKTPPQEPNRVTQTMEVEQAKLCMGFDVRPFANARDYYTFAVMNTVLGGGPQSKLFNEVREKNSLCYYVSSKPDRQKAAMFISAGIESADFQKAYDEILRQVDAVKGGEITAEELDASKRYYINGLSSLDDSVYQMEDYYLSCLLAGEVLPVEEVIELVRGVDAAAVQEYAQSLTLDTVYLLTGNE